VLFNGGHDGNATSGGWLKEWVGCAMSDVTIRYYNSIELEATSD
jgi:hypothetical protein